MRTIVKLCLVLCLLVSSASIAAAENNDGFVAQAQASNIQLWLVSTRDLPVTDDLPANVLKMRYQRFLPAGGMADSTREEFEASDSPDIPTSIIVHGSPADLCLVLESGRRLYKELVYQAPQGATGRIVLWTWPSDKVCRRLIPDFRLKASWSEYQGYYLARFVDRIDSKVPVSFVGYSFGARTVGVALHLLGGGSFPDDDQLGIPEPKPRARPMSVLFVATAIDTDWLNPDSRYGQALSVVGYALNTTNFCDPLLKRYHMLCSLRHGPTAIGYEGIGDVSQLGTYSDRYEEIDVSSDAARTHDIFRYMDSDALMQRLLTMLYSPAELPKR